MAVKKKTLFADVLETVTKYFLILVAVVVLFILFSGIRVVESGQVALVLRFGELVGDNYEEQVHEPGLLFAFPYFIDEVIIIPEKQVMEQTVMTHYTSGTNLEGARGGYLITGDRNVATVAASVKYTVTDPVAYALYIQDIPSIVDGVVSSAMVNQSVVMDVDKLLTTDKLSFASNVTDFAMNKLNAMGVGVEITSLELTQVAMPEEVRAVYENVNAARLQANTIIERAYQFQATMIPQAESEAHTMVSNAKSAKTQAMAAAKVELAEFWGVVDEYMTDEKGVKNRLYNERLKRIFEKIGKVYVVDDEAGQKPAPSP
jgi:membrane protease subunit HflK